MNLSTNLESIKGVGPKTAEQLRQAGLHTVGDMITFLPRRHEDFSEVVAISDITPGKRTIKARVESVETRRARRGMTVTTATLIDTSSRLSAVWFNQPYRKTQFKPSDEYYFSGEFEFRSGRYQLTNPSAERVSDLPVQTDRILPIYPMKRGLKSQLVRKIMLELRPLITMLPETLPPSVVTHEKLVSYADALLGLHFPKAASDIEAARTRLGFEELFSLLLASQLNRQDNATLAAPTIAFDKAFTKKFVDQLPFHLTDAQRVAAWEIIQDLEREQPMNRLLQGDVGSGKTVVAAMAALAAAGEGYQTALMAPTEILARQHAATLAGLLEPFGVTVGLAIGANKPAARKVLYDNIERGAVAVVVGTHALIQDSLAFHNLGLVVIDEQHRFGVEQRQKLLAKVSQPAAKPTMPHLLAMTATPIPRSLQLTVFGELDISILNQRPKGRLPIKTQLVNPVSTDRVYGQIDQEIAAGRQAYVICSLIDDNPESDKKSVETEYKKLQNSVFGHRKIGLLHGRMKPNEKEQVMSDFKARKYDILVSTTVVEVGVDVPNASCIMIENADHFGLAQLHQLRGRVGRGEHQSYCYLMMSDSKRPSERLREIEKSEDGFYLAEVDLRLRGPGEIYGRMQHGDLNLQIASLADTRSVKRADLAARQFIASGENLLQYKQLSEAVAHYQRVTTLN